MTHTAENDAPVPPEDWCDHHPEWSDNAGLCHHPDCTVTGPHVYVIPPGVASSTPATESGQA